MSTISASTTSTTGFKVTSDTTGTLVLQTGSSPTTAVTIATTQYVNVGTGTSSYPLQIATNPSGSSQAMLAINPATGTNGAILYFNNSGSGGLLLGRSDSAGAGSGTTITAYDSFLATTGTTGLSFHTNNTRAMYISSGQLVGIGTSTPSQKLSVSGGTIRCDLGSSGTSMILTGTGSNLQVSHTSSNYVTVENSGGAILLKSNNSATSGIVQYPSNPPNRAVKWVICNGDSGTNTAQVYWNNNFGSAQAGGCLGAYDRSGNYASPSTSIGGSDQWSIYGFVSYVL